MYLCWVSLHVKDMEESLAFYHDTLGLPIAKRFEVGHGIQIAMLGESKKTMIELIADGMIQQTEQQMGISIGFQVVSLDDSINNVERHGFPIRRGPISPLPGIRFCFLHDPNGFEIQLVEQE